ncbi:hypothetical protein HNP00_003292 [Arthrobacter sp. AZCC_0090]|nr:hypothetical protein [Arthrobacter sp. AZCC_0090]
MVESLEHVEKGVRRENPVGIHEHQDVAVGRGNPAVQRRTLPRVGLRDGADPAVFGSERGHDGGRLIGGTVIHQNHFKPPVPAGQDGFHETGDHDGLVIPGDDHRHERLPVKDGQPVRGRLIAVVPPRDRRTGTKGDSDI